MNIKIYIKKNNIIKLNIYYLLGNNLLLNFKNKNKKHKYEF